MSVDKPEQSFHAERLPARGEIFAWGMTLFTGLVWAVLIFLKVKTPLWIPVLLFFLLISALLIRLSNYIDAHTVLSFYPDRLEFKDGIRTIGMKWESISGVEVYKSNWGEKIHVIGKERTFYFRTLGVVKLRGEVKGKIGFAEGKMILETIIERSQLGICKSDSKYDYYTRCK